MISAQRACLVLLPALQVSQAQRACLVLLPALQVFQAQVATQVRFTLVLKMNLFYLNKTLFKIQ